MWLWEDVALKLLCCTRPRVLYMRSSALYCARHVSKSSPDKSEGLRLKAAPRRISSFANLLGHLWAEAAFNFFRVFATIRVLADLFPQFLEQGFEHSEIARDDPERSHHFNVRPVITLRCEPNEVIQRYFSCRNTREEVGGLSRDFRRCLLRLARIAINSSSGFNIRRPQPPGIAGAFKVKYSKPGG